MGYYIFSNGIKVGKLQEVFGSNDEELLNKVLKSDLYKQYFGKELKKSFLYKRYFAEDYKNGVVARPLKDIIEGNTLVPSLASYYGYALLCLCFTLGEKLPFNLDIKIGYETDYIDQLLEENFNIKNFKIDKKLFQNIDAFSIPEISDWPMIGVLYKDQLLEIQNALSSVIITDEFIEKLENSEDYEDEEKSYAAANIRGLVENIAFCLENDLDLVSFCH